MIWFPPLPLISPSCGTVYLCTYIRWLLAWLLQIRERVHDLQAEVQHLNEAWEQHRAFLAAIYEYQVFLKEEKMVDGTSSAHEVCAFS